MKKWYIHSITQVVLNFRQRPKNSPFILIYFSQFKLNKRTFTIDIKFKPFNNQVEQPHISTSP